MRTETRVTSTDGIGGPRIATRADGGSSPLVGYASVFFRPSDPGSQYTIDSGLVERISPEAFDNALLRGDDVRALFNHDATIVLGRTSSGTVKLSVDAVGLRYEITLPNTAAARDLAESIRRGDITGSSFAFKADRDRFYQEGKTTVRELLDLRLFDVGPVTYPAYKSTTAGLSGRLPAAHVLAASADSGGKPRSTIIAPAGAWRLAHRLRLMELDHLDQLAGIRI